MAKANRATLPTEDGEGASESQRHFSIPVDAQDKPRWDLIKGRRRERLRGIMQDPDTSEALGVKTPDFAAPPAADVDPGLCAVLYDSLSTLMVGLARMKGYTEDQSKVLRFSAQERDALTGPTVRVLNKYSGQMGKYQDEMLLLLAIVTMISGKLSALRKSASVISMADRMPPASDSIS